MANKRRDGIDGQEETNLQNKNGIDKEVDFKGREVKRYKSVNKIEV